MAESARITTTVNPGSGAVSQNVDVVGNVKISSSVKVPAAKSGTLTTRSSASAGTLTMAASHGITTGARLDLYWAGGSRRGIVVGTVSVNSVPISGGSGDDLPLATTVVKAMVPLFEAVAFEGDDLQGLFLLTANKRATIVFVDGSDAELFAKVVASGALYEWHLASGVTNPLAGDTVAKVFYSHGEAADVTLRTVALTD